jgi:O-succinylbenzoate synthase
MEATPGGAAPPFRDAWDALGTGAALVLDGAELVEVALPVVAPIATAVGVHRNRPLVLVHLRCRTPGGGTVVHGWGECAALGDATYDTEDVQLAWTTLEQVLLPGLASAARSLGGLLPSLGSLRRLAALAPGRPLSFAALEGAVADAHLRAAGRPFAELLGVAGAEVAPGAVVGTARSPDEVVAAVAALAGEGYCRVKVKVTPDTARATVSAVAAWAAGAEGNVPRLQVDANGAFDPGDIDRLVALDGFGLLCIEQPFARDDLESHRRLAARITTPVCLDESLDGPRAVETAVATGACSVVCVKPARLGGIGAALEVVAWCTAAGVPWWVGGMFESGLGRRVNTALGALPGPSLPGDLAPPATYLAVDLVGPPSTRVDPDTGTLVVTVSDVPGSGPVPDDAVLGARTVRRFEV